MSTNHEDSCGWRSDLPTFYQTMSATVVSRLIDFVRDASPEQQSAWRTHVPVLQEECRELAHHDAFANSYTAILEYQLPYELRRVDLIVLERAAVVVAEIKGYHGLTSAAFDQVLAYARDLRAYHRECANRPVVPVLISSAAARPPWRREGVTVCHPEDVDTVLSEIAHEHPGAPARAEDFVAPGAYLPLPTIVQAARQLFETRELPYIKRARSATEPALKEITAIAHQAAKDGTRHLILLSGIPGSGKTLVGLQLVHSRWLDDLAEPRDRGTPTAAGVYLSGNGPLVRVLQDALKDGGGGGKTFVRAIKDYVDYYSKRHDRIPPEHLIVFDEAQRAHDAEQVERVHGRSDGLSEPEHLLRFCERIPRWSVLVALIGTGQAIHVGEEVGLPLWRMALDDVAKRQTWTVHCAPALAEHFTGGPFGLNVTNRLNLTSELRFHFAADVHRLVEGLLTGVTAEALRPVADRLHQQQFRFLLTRDLDSAKQYVRDRYADAPLARYGLLASSKDKILPGFGVDNTFQTTKTLREGPWYNSDPHDPRSCCQLRKVATEFASQGLELDFAILAWGSDLRRVDGGWKDDLSRGYRSRVKDRLQLRKNVYRVLLTRGRDGTVVFVPRSDKLDETFEYLLACGFRELP
ncbi:MAG: DNA/RNA helicase domain-containing protein [Gammaproteobacteria bacterium]